MIDPNHPRLSIVRQCELASASAGRPSTTRGRARRLLNLELMRRDRRAVSGNAVLRLPADDSPPASRRGYCVSRKRIRRLMRKMGLTPIYQKPRTSVPHPEHRIYPYLLRDVPIDRPDHVWCADITYIPDATRLPLPGCHHGLGQPSRSCRGVSRTRWTRASASKPSRKRCVASDRQISSTPTKACQFTSFDFTQVLKDAGVRISMDGKGRWTDNIFIERLWRSLKYECIYLHAFETGSEAQTGHRSTGSTFTTTTGLTRPWVAGLPTRPIEASTRFYRSGAPPRFSEKTQTAA